MFEKTRLVIVFSFVICHLSFVISPAAAFPELFPAPALNGSTGMVRIPSADIVPYKNFNVGADYSAPIGIIGGTTEAALSYKMNLGTFHGVELGIVGGTAKNNNQLREGVFVNMKLSLSTGDDPYPLLLAIGTENLFSYTQTDVYMVATKYFKQGPKVTFGFMADFPENKFRPMGLLGAETPLSNNFLLLGELMAAETLFQVNAGAKFYFTPIFSLSVSTLNLLNGAQTKDGRSTFAGFSWANPF